APPQSRGYLFRFRQAGASVVIVSWSAFSSPASKSPRVPGGLMPKLLTQGVSLEPKNGRQLIGIVAGFKSERWPVIDRNAGRRQLGIRRFDVLHKAKAILTERYRVLVVLRGIVCVRAQHEAKLVGAR